MELLGTLHHHLSYEDTSLPAAPSTIVNGSGETRLDSKDTLPSSIDHFNPFKTAQGCSWKERMVAIAALVTVSIISPIPSLAFTPSTPRCVTCLRYGDQGERVVYVQDQLKVLGFFSARSTGYFGSLTQTAVRQFQQTYNLRIDGIVGPQTQQKLDQMIFGDATTFVATSATTRSPSLTPPTISASRTIRASSVIRPGNIGSELYLDSEGAQVRDVQELLQRAGFYRGRLTGYYGFLTTTAVEEFQRSEGITPTGITGQKTLSALISRVP